MTGGLEHGRQVLKALQMDDGFTHLEWFLTSSGEVVFGEVGARPGGAHLVDQMNYTSDIDLFREWARCVCWHHFEANAERKYNVAIIFKRARGQGRIRSITGLESFREEHGAHIVSEQLLPVGASRRNWKHTLVSDGFLIVRHADWEESKTHCVFGGGTDRDAGRHLRLARPLRARFGTDSNRSSLGRRTQKRGRCQRASKTPFSKAQRYVWSSPTSSVFFGSNPSARIRETSRSLRGVPSGQEVSNSMVTLEAGHLPASSGRARRSSSLRPYRR